MAMQFNAGNRVNLGTGINVPASTTLMSISGWVRLDLEPAQDPRLIAKGFGTASGESIWALSVSASNERPQFRVRVGGVRQITSLAGVGTLALGQWFFLTGTYNGSTGIISIYTDGVLQNAESVTAGNVDTTADETWLGDQPVTGTRFLDGAIDDIRIYNRELRPDEMMTMMAAKGGDNIVNNLLYRWPLLDRGLGVSSALGVTDIQGDGSGIGETGDGAAPPVFTAGIVKPHRRRHPPGVVSL